MRAEPGAVYQVRIDAETGKVVYRTIGGQKAAGICGSGLVDCLAELLLAGIIDRVGKFRDTEKEFVVVPASEFATEKDITFTQTDIDNIMRTSSITYFELNASEVFMNKFVGSKFLPHTNLDYYPTVKEKMLRRGLLRD